MILLDKINNRTNPVPKKTFIKMKTERKLKKTETIIAKHEIYLIFSCDAKYKVNSSSSFSAAAAAEFYHLVQYIYSIISSIAAL